MLMFPKWHVVTERLLHEERNHQDSRSNPDKALLLSRQKKGLHCGKPGHYKKDCSQLYYAENDKSKSHNKNNKPAKNQASFGQHSSGESDVLECCVTFIVDSGTTCHMCVTWIVDSGTTCHMCHDKMLFSEFR